MCGSMVDIQSATAEIRQGEKEEEEEEHEERKKEITTRRKYNGLPYSITEMAGYLIVVCRITNV